MDHQRWQRLVLLGFLMLLPLICNAQWYQGPSGGQGGEPFDHWKTTNGETEIAGIGVLQDSSIRCIFVRYRQPSTSSPRNGYCDPPPGPLSFNGGGGFNLDPDEYLIGISGRFGDHINSIMFYTNKRTSPAFGGSGGTDTFSYTAPTGQRIVGFFGRAGDNLDAIGVLYAPIKKTPDKTTRPTKKAVDKATRPTPP
jgi:hypothetical protein